MKLLTKEIQKKLPGLYSTENIPCDEKVAVVKFFTPDANYTWYGIEFDPESQTFFGLVKGQETELGYFNLNDLKMIRGRWGLPVERDRGFCPKTIAELKKNQFAY